MSGDVVERFPDRIWASPKGEYGQGFEAIKLATWSEKREYREGYETEYVRADLIASQAAEIEQLTKENTDLMAARNENAKLRGQRDAALARIKQMQDSNSRMAEGWSALTTRAETAERLLAEMKDTFRNADASDWDHLFVMLHDTGRGRFWKSVMTSFRSTLTNGGENGR